MGIEFDLEGNHLVALRDNVWIVDGALLYPVGRFPVRMAVIRLEDDKLLVWSPFKPTKELVQEIEALGTVAYIVAPNSLHWLGVMPFFEACSNKDEIQVCVAPGLATKQEAIDAGLKWNYVLPDCPNEWEDQIQVKHVPGMPQLEEVVVYHTTSKTLLVGDLAFHFQRDNPKLNVSGIIPYYLYCCDGYRPCCLTRTFWYVATDVEASHQAMQQVLQEFDFDCILLAHGEIIQESAKAMLENGTVSLLQEWRNAPKGRSLLTSSRTMTAIALTAGVAIAYTAYRKR